MTPTPRSRPEQVRDLIMMVILGVWLIYAVIAVLQLFTSGSKALDSLPPFYWWGIPLAPYTALYTPWINKTVPATEAPAPPPAEEVQP